MCTLFKLSSSTKYKSSAIQYKQWCNWLFSFVFDSKNAYRLMKSFGDSVWLWLHCCCFVAAAVLIASCYLFCCLHMLCIQLIHSSFFFLHSIQFNWTTKSHVSAESLTIRRLLLLWICFGKWQTLINTAIMFKIIYACTHSSQANRMATVIFRCFNCTSQSICFKSSCTFCLFCICK